MHEVGSSIIEIAKRLGITRQAVYQKIKEGKLQVENLGNHRYKLLDNNVPPQTGTSFTPQDTSSAVDVPKWTGNSDEPLQRLMQTAKKTSSLLRLRVRLIKDQQ